MAANNAAENGSDTLSCHCQGQADSVTVTVTGTKRDVAVDDTGDWRLDRLLVGGTGNRDEGERNPCKWSLHHFHFVNKRHCPVDQEWDEETRRDT